MLRFIERLRQKPQPVRSFYAFWMAAAFTLLVAGVWSISLPGRVATMIEETVSADLSPSRPTNRFMADVRAGVAGLFGAESPEATPYATATSTGVYEIDVTALQPATSTDSVEQGSSTATAGVWQRTYTNTEGRPVLIATTTTATATTGPDTVDPVVQ